VPPEQVSLVVQAFPSLQEAVLFVYWQVPDTQESVVQTFPSEQSAATEQSGARDAATMACRLGPECVALAVSVPTAIAGWSAVERLLELAFWSVPSVQPFPHVYVPALPQETPATAIEPLTVFTVTVIGFGVAALATLLALCRIGALCLTLANVRAA
jgi:hypothetical protein